MSKLKTESNLERAAASEMEAFSTLEKMEKIRATFSSLKEGFGASLIREIRRHGVSRIQGYHRLTSLSAQADVGSPSRSGEG